MNGDSLSWKSNDEYIPNLKLSILSISREKSQEEGYEIESKDGIVSAQLFTSGGNMPHRTLFLGTLQIPQQRRGRLDGHRTPYLFTTFSCKEFNIQHTEYTVEE
jgi:hypothetical protein